MKAIEIMQPIETRGCLDEVALAEDGLFVRGWAASLDAGPVDGFAIAYAGKQIASFKLTSGLPSPDVKQVYPNLCNAENARFSAIVPLDKEQRDSWRDSLIAVTPLIQGRAGCVLLKLIEPSLPIPSEENIHFIGGGFAAVALEFLGHFLQRGGLQPTDSVLDVGCGVGRMAYALAYYLKPPGRYEGFDIVDELIQWSQKEITPRVGNFNFRKVDIYNHLYNPNGTVQAADFIFPYEDGNFDFVFLTSVFTHLQGREVRHYLDEIWRVLKPGGRCLCTCFLLEEESESLIAAGKSTQNFVHELEDCFTTHPAVPETAIGYKQPLLLEWIAARGFAVRGKYYGAWCGRASFVSYQDMLVLQKN